ncbi:hypothetical protein ILUMI_15372 [Ignelater luminosus]|uniref:Myb/SANT-like DNA-binding domain-containing protein n=1 Tax=Ignelater luminosus TaxID=2038154 RepID=A0A8K0CT54_IGNLU|nr:hypothetical protein ILUMI_15372 [Ignelater luminosus]
MLFLDAYEKLIEQFRNPKIKKKKLWKKIASVMEETGCIVDSAILDKKMRNMKCTFTRIKDNNKKKRTGRGAVSWEYFSRFEDIFASDKSVNPLLSRTSPRSLVQVAICLEFVNIKAVCIACNTIPDRTSDTVVTPSNKEKRVDFVRKRQLQIEKGHWEKLKKIRQEIQENNQINREKLLLLQQFLNT